MSSEEELSFAESLSDTSILRSDLTPFKWQHLVALVMVLFWFWLGRTIYDFYYRFLRRGSTPKFTLAEELTRRDNKASAVDFAAFLFSVGMITIGSLDDLPVEESQLGRYFYTYVFYQIFGLILMMVARAIMDHVVLRKIDVVKAIIDDGNMGVAAVESAVTVASGLVISAAATGFDANFGNGVLATLIYWIVGQVLLIMYVIGLDFVSGKLYTEKTITGCEMTDATAAPTGATNTDPAPAASGVSTAPVSRSILSQVQGGNNVAAGVSLGFDIVIAALLIRHSIVTGFSLVAILIWFVLSVVIIMPVMHLYMDNLILMGVSYHDNVMRSKNWGAAYLLGSLKLLTAFVLGAIYRENCSASTMNLASGICDQPLFDKLSVGEKLGHVGIPNVFSWQSVVNLFLLLALMGLAKGIFYLRFILRNGFTSASDYAKSFSLDEKLRDTHNNAVAISMGSFCGAIGLGMVGVMDCPSENVGLHAAFLLLWTAIGTSLMLVSMLINDKLLLRGVCNAQALLEDNVAVACMESGSFLACGIIMKATLSGSGLSFEESLAITIIYWLVTQAMLLLFTVLYRVVTTYDDLALMKEKNYAAGLSGAFYLIALSIILSYPIYIYSSIVVFLPVAVSGCVLLILLRVIVDKALLPGDKLDDEVRQVNWGASFVEGASAVSLAFILTLYIPGDIGTCDM